MAVTEMWTGAFGAKVPPPKLTGLDLRRARRYMQRHPRRFGGQLKFMRSLWCAAAVEPPTAEEVAQAHAHPKREAASQRLLLARKLQTFFGGIFGPGVVAWEVAL